MNKFKVYLFQEEGLKYLNFIEELGRNVVGENTAC